MADFVSQALVTLGIRHVFGVTGRGSLFLTDGLARNAEIDFVPMLHEQSSGFAANAVAQSRKSWSACVVSSGVAATNIITPMLNAWQDQLPTIFISGQNHLPSSTTDSDLRIRTFGEQETNIVALTRNISNSSLFVDRVDSFPTRFLELIKASRNGRPGPVLLDVPLDIQSAQISDDDELTAVLRKLESMRLTLASGERQMGQSSKSNRTYPPDTYTDPVVVLLGPAFDELVDSIFISKLKTCGIPVVVEQGANSRYFGPNLLGTAGFLACSPAANQALFNAKKVLAIGTSFRNNLCLPNLSLIGSDAEVWIIDFDENDLSPHLPATRMNFIDVNRNLCSVLQEFLSSSPTRTSEVVPDARSTTPSDVTSPWIDLNYLAQNINSLLPDNAIVVVDSGFCQLIISGQGMFSEGQVLIQPHSQGCMGVAVAAGIGCSKEFPGRPVVVITGDGSLLMNSQDMISMASIPNNLKLLVVDNDLYSIINKRQRELFRGRTIGTNVADGMPNVDLLRLMQGSGLRVRDERGKNLSQIMEFESFFTQKETMAMIISGDPTQGYTTCKLAPSGDSKLVTSSPWLSD